MPDGRHRRSPVEADALRARMIAEGYPLGDLTMRENHRIWVSLTQRRRWQHLQWLTGMSDAALAARVKAISHQHYALTERK